MIDTRSNKYRYCLSFATGCTERLVGDLSGDVTVCACAKACDPVDCGEAGGWLGAGAVRLGGNVGKGLTIADVGIGKDPDLPSLQRDPHFAALVADAKERAVASAPLISPAPRTQPGGPNHVRQQLQVLFREP